MIYRKLGINQRFPKEGSSETDILGRGASTMTFGFGIIYRAQYSSDSQEGLWTAP
jgi:hypothetical protein